MGQMNTYGRCQYFFVNKVWMDGQVDFQKLGLLGKTFDDMERLKNNKLAFKRSVTHHVPFNSTLNTTYHTCRYQNN